MKTAKNLIGLIVFMMISAEVVSQNINEAVISGQIFYITQKDTTMLKESRFELIRITPGGYEKLIDDYYTDDKGKFLLSNIPFGKYYLKIYYGSDEPLYHLHKKSQPEKGFSFTIDGALKMIPPQYVYSTNKKRQEKTNNQIRQ